jgi:2-hydroxychromene-2-carboxylate isomerase
MPASIAFYFDFISPFSYFAIQRLPQIAERVGREIAYHVVDLAVLKRVAGNTAPPTRDMPIKLRYMRADQARWARRYGVPVKAPAHYDSGLLNRGVFFAQSKDMIPEYVSLVFHRVWGEGGHMTDPVLISGIARDLEWDDAELRQFIASEAATRHYEASTSNAHQRGVFGVPTMIVGEEMWWGNDRLDFMEEELTAAEAHPAAAG